MEFLEPESKPDKIKLFIVITIGLNHELNFNKKLYDGGINMNPYINLYESYKENMAKLTINNKYINNFNCKKENHNCKRCILSRLIEECNFNNIGFSYKSLNINILNESEIENKIQIMHYDNYIVNILYISTNNINLSNHIQVNKNIQLLDIEYIILNYARRNIFPTIMVKSARKL